MLGGMVGTMFKQDYGSTSPFGLWRDDYDRRAREGESKYYAINRPSWMVAGAKAAGIHPNVLFGGAGAGHSAGANTRPPPSGAAPSWTPPRAQSSADQRLKVLAIDRAEIENDIAREQLAASQAGRAYQGQIVRNPDGSITEYPGGDGVGPPETIKPGDPMAGKRGSRHEPHVTSPLRQKLYDDQGRELWVYSESAQADEINQAILAYQDARNQWRDYVQKSPNAQTRKEKEYRLHMKRRLWQQRKQIEDRLAAFRSNKSRRAGAKRRSDEKRRTARERGYEKSMGSGSAAARNRANRRRFFGSEHRGY